MTALALAALLTGCIGDDDNHIAGGLTVHIAEVHTETAPGSPPANANTIPDSASVTGGYDQLNLEQHPVRDTNGRTLSLYRAYVVLDEIELVPCIGAAPLAHRLLNGLFPAAHAHTGHGSEPVGGRALDKPNVIDIVTQEDFILPLGDAAVAPGSYCWVKASLARLASDAYGKPAPEPASTDNPVTAPEVPDMSGRIFAIRSDYCTAVDGFGACTNRGRIDIDDNGLTAPVARILAFDTPLTLGASRREAHVVVGIAHGEWLQGVDITLLPGNTSELQKLLDNIADSIHINAAGPGALPANAP